jgi:hypothetical protein
LSTRSKEGLKQKGIEKKGGEEGIIIIRASLELRSQKDPVDSSGTRSGRSHAKLHCGRRY